MNYQGAVSAELLPNPTPTPPLIKPSATFAVTCQFATETQRAQRTDIGL